MVKKESKGIIRRCSDRFIAWTGTGGFMERMHDLSSHWKSFLHENSERLKMNIEGGRDTAALPFDNVLLSWGILTPMDLKNYIKSQKHNLYTGVFLLLFGGIGSFFQPKSGMLGFLSSFSCGSVAALGAVLITTATWRLHVIRKKKFVPFETWIRHPLAVIKKGLQKKTSPDRTDV